MLRSRPRADILPATAAVAATAAHPLLLIAAPRHVPRHARRQKRCGITGPPARGIAHGAAAVAAAARAPEAKGHRLRFGEVLLALPRASCLYLGVFAVWWDYRRARRRAQKKRRQLGLPLKAARGEEEPEEVEAIWESAHERNAPRVRRLVDRLRGLWVKAGQYLSSRPDVVPAAYIESLAGLQDGTPATPWRKVAATLRRELGPSWAETLRVEEDPIASASVAQVHRGWLRKGEEPVAVKVQHPGVDAQMRLDLVNLSMLLALLRRSDPEQDWRPVVSEWSAAVRLELDFAQEAASLREVAQNLEAARVKAIVPKPKGDLVTRRILVMDFCAGVPARSPEQLAALGVDRALFVERVCAAFAVQIHQFGFFNADPHPGNVHVSVDARQNQGDPNVPVLLDYGLTKRFETPMLLAFARLMHSSHASDPDGLEQALEEMGFIFERDPLEDVVNMRRLFTAVPRSQAAARRRARAEAERRREQEQPENAKRARRRRPIEAWPSELIFFLRVTGLLKGLAASLDVPVDYMGLMARAARKTLRESVAASITEERLGDGVSLKLGPGSGIRRDPGLPAKSKESRLQRRLEALLEQLHNDGALRGMQVSVAGPGGKKLASACAGELGPVDPRPVLPDSLFCVFSAGKAPCAATVLRLAEKGTLQLNAPVAEYWPAFSANAKGSCTVKHVLRHQAGLADAFPAGATLEQLLDGDAMADFVARACPDGPPGMVTRYHYLTFGWILSGLVKSATGETFSALLQSLVVSRLGGLAGEMFLGVPEELLSRDGRLASLEVKLALGDIDSSPSAAGINTDVPLMSPALFNMRKVRAAEVPSANLHCSARALARFYAGLAHTGCSGEALLGTEMLSELCCAGESDENDTMGGAEPPALDSQYGLGMRLYDFLAADGTGLRGVGHAGFGGSVGFAIPALGVGIAVTVNRLEFGGLGPQEVINLICNELGVVPPASLVETRVRERAQKLVH